MNKTSAVEVKIQPVLAPFKSWAREIDGTTNSARLIISFELNSSFIISIFLLKSVVTGFAGSYSECLF